jgi:hypothetical protein
MPNVNMKFTLSLIIVLLFAVASNAQFRPITAEEYDKVFEYAVSETNTAYPVILTVKTDTIENGKIVSTESQISENEAEQRERVTKTTVTNGQTTHEYRITIGFDKNYCSDDGVH